MTVDLSRMSSQDLVDATLRLAGRGRALEAALLRHLGEVDARQLHLGQGYPSMFVFCVEKLRFSEATAYRRIRAARAARRFPALVAAIESGVLHVTAIALICSRLTQENCDEWIRRASHRTKEELKEMLADEQPKPDLRTVVSKLPAASGAKSRPVIFQPSAAAATAGCGAPTDSSPFAPAREAAKPAPPPNRRAKDGPVDRAEPMGAQRYRVSFTADAAMYAEIRELRDLLRHQVPDGDLGEILGKAVSRLLAEVRKRRFAEVGRPRVIERSGPATRHIPAAIRRDVFRRDEGRCAYVSPGGRRCGAREFLEFHHLKPWARGRVHTVEAIGLRCRAHNQYAERESAEPPTRRGTACSGTGCRAPEPRV